MKSIIQQDTRKRKTRWLFGYDFAMAIQYAYHVTEF